MQKVDDLWVLNDLPAGVGAGTQFKYVILAGKNPPRWENRANRNWREVRHQWSHISGIAPSALAEFHGHKLQGT